MWTPFFAFFPSAGGTITKLPTPFTLTRLPGDERSSLVSPSSEAAVRALATLEAFCSLLILRICADDGADPED